MSRTPNGPVPVPPARRARAAQALADLGALVLVGAGDPVPRPGGQDQTYPFEPHPEYAWLTGLDRSGGVLALEPPDRWTSFVRPTSEAERVWEGTGDAPAVEDPATLPDWLRRRAGLPVVVLGEPGAATAGVALDPARTAAARERLDAVRRRKDEAELSLVERAVAATAAGHAAARAAIRPGVTERELRIELEAAMLRAGADATGYGTTVGSGPNAAVLHCEPGARTFRPGDVVLIDAGGAVRGYTADVTRTWPVGPAFPPRAQVVRDLVLAAEEAAIAACRPGVEWHDVHRVAARVLATGLRDEGLLRGDVEGLLESEAIARFFPHGVGHMVGLGVRDVGGRAPGRPPGRRCCGVAVRVDLPLEEGFLMTVEPGLYFIPALLDDPAVRDRFRDAIAWDALGPWREVGGVRIEDDVLVGAGAPRVLTAGIPR